MQQGEEPPGSAEILRFSELYNAHLLDSNCASDAWQRYNDQVPAKQRDYFNDIQQRLRAQYHIQQTLDRRSRLSSLLAQTPPFSLSEEDRQRSKTRQGQRKRSAQFKQFVGQQASKSAIGVHPFFASLKRVLEYQGSGHLDRSCRWTFDDAVLMEAGGKGWMDSAVWILKGVLHFEEEQATSNNDPFVGENESLRCWTVAGHLSDPECVRLARLIPSHVLPSRGRGSETIQSVIPDEETARETELPTGKVSISDTFRDKDYRGSLVERLWGWLVARWC